MDKTVTVRFYDVYKRDRKVPALRKALKDIYDTGNAQSRQATLDSGTIARLERLEITNDFVTGEFTRIQDTNFPSEVRRDKVEPLGVNGMLGHGIAFRFRISDSVLAIQYEPRVLAPSRINSYILAMQSEASYEFRPRLNGDNWRRMAQRPLRKLVIGVASPSDLADIEGAGASVAESLRQMGDAYEAPSITIELGMGRRNGALGEDVKKMATQMFKKFLNDEVDLRKLRGVIETEEGIPNDEVNLIEEVLAQKDELSLPHNDPLASYEIRKKWLARKMREHA